MSRIVREVGMIKTLRIVKLVEMERTVRSLRMLILLRVVRLLTMERVVGIAGTTRLVNKRE